MDKEYIKTMDADEFESATDYYFEMLTELRSEACASLEHGDIEDLIETRGTELMRRMFQAYLDRRSANEPRLAAVTGSDGVLRTHARRMARWLETVFGRVTLWRWHYCSRESAPGLFPLDAALNLPDDAYSHGLRRRGARLAGANSYDEAVRTVAETTGGHVPKASMERIAERTSLDFEEFYEGRAVSREETTDLLVISQDCKGIAMRRKDLLERTRKAAELADGKRRKHRLGSGEKRNRKRLAAVATVYGVKRHERTPESVMETTDEKKAPPPKPTDKRVWASIAKKVTEVTETAFDEAARRDPGHRREWVALLDGDKKQLRGVKAAARRRGVELTVVVDVIHVIEYLWKAALCFHSAKGDAIDEWVSDRLLKILRGEASSVAAGMRRSATMQGLSKTKRKGVDKCAGYLLNYKEHLRYDEYLAKGYPIATGVIEGACRHLVKDRMEKSGARWSLAGAEAVLRLRSLDKSGDFDEYWRFHRRREHVRNHESKYVDFYPMKAA